MTELTLEQINSMADDAATLAALGATDSAKFSEIDGDVFLDTVAGLMASEPDQPAQTLFLRTMMALDLPKGADLEIYFAVFVAVWTALQDYRAPDPVPAATPRPKPVPGGRGGGLARKISDPKNSMAKTGFLKK